MVTRKDTFLASLTRALKRETVPLQPTPLRLPNTVQDEYFVNASTLELKNIFIEQSKKNGTLVHECTVETLNTTILTAISELGKGPLLVADDQLFHQQQTIAALSKVYTDVSMWDSTQSRKNNIDVAEAAGIGIAVAQHALAETGTVMLYCHKGCGRAVTLLPTTTIFIINDSHILPRLTQSMTWLDEHKNDGLASSVNYISGASSTADIELVRVQGVHGPIQIAYIIVSA